MITTRSAQPSSREGKQANLGEARERLLLLAKETDARVAVEPIASDEEAPLGGGSVRELDRHALLMLLEVDKLVPEMHGDPTLLRGFDQRPEEDRAAHAFEAIPGQLVERLTEAGEFALVPWDVRVRDCDLYSPADYLLKQPGDE